MTKQRISKIIRAAIKKRLIGEEFSSLCLIDIENVLATIAGLKAAFPDNFNHAFAAKANSLRGVLELVREAGMDCEVASPGELEQAWRCGFSAKRIVYDEPAKKRSVIKLALERGVSINADNFGELVIIGELLKNTTSDSVIGIRINPQVGSGSIAATSTATATSKFGISLKDAGNRKLLIDTYAANPWLRAVHLHVGSQGCGLSLMAEGVRAVVELADEVNRTIGLRQIKTVDIGGGLPVNFDCEAVKPSFAEYAAVLRDQAPQLFSGEYRVITEFGRSILAKSGVIASLVEYVKNSGGQAIALTHLGANIATRNIFMPGSWPLRISAYDAQGRIKEGDEVSQDIAGPCCFSGDVIASGRMLPRLQPGDIVVAHDTGAYCFSSPFYYNSFAAPAVYGVRLHDDGVDFDCYRPQQTIDQVLDIVG